MGFLRRWPALRVLGARDALRGCAGLGEKEQQFRGLVLTYLDVVYDLRPEYALYVASWFKTQKDDPKTIVIAEKFQIGAGLSGYVAEISAAQLCAVMGIAPSLRHAAYIQSWLTLMKSDRRAIFTAASQASAAVDYLLKCAGHQERDDSLQTPDLALAA